MNIFQVLKARTPEEEQALREEAAATFPDIIMSEYGGIDTVYTPDGQRLDYHAMPKDKYSIDDLQKAVDVNASRSAIREGIFDYVLNETGNLSVATDAAQAADYTPILGTAIGLEDANISRQEVMPYIQEGDYKSAGIEAINTALGMGEAALTVAPIVGPAARNVVSSVRNTVRNRRLPNQTYFTHEAVPYAGIGRNVSERNVGSAADPHMPAIADMSDEQLVNFTLARSYIDQTTGTDRLLAEVLDAEQLRPTLSGRGVYDGPDGLEENPVAVARAVDVDPADAQATETVRSLLDVQGATPFTSLKGGDMPAIFVPHADNEGTKEAMDALKKAGAQYGVTDVMDVGDGYILTNFSGGEVNTSTKARRSIGKATGTDPISTTTGGGYPSLEGALEGGLVSTVDRVVENLSQANPAAVEALKNSSVVRDLARERAQKLFTERESLGGVNRDVVQMTGAIQRSGLEGLENLAETYRAREIPRQIPNLRGGASTDVTHFSQERRDVIDPAMQFSSDMRGAEQGLPAPYPAQSYFGVNVGKEGGYYPEANVGDVRHEARLDNLLDISEGFPPDITEEAERAVARLEIVRGQELSAAERQGMISSYQMQIAKQRGYDGLYHPKHELGSIATSFFPVTPR